MPGTRYRARRYTGARRGRSYAVMTPTRSLRSGSGRRGSLRRRRGQIFPLLAAAIPAIITGAKLAAGAAAGGAISYGVKKALEKVAS